jgi:hypothetical protein
MSVKYVCIIVDDFTDKALAYPNVQLYDYGEESSVTYWDSYYYDYYQYPNIGPFGYGDVDSTFVNFSNSDYYHQSQFYAPTVTDAGTLDPILSDYNAYFDLYMLEGYNEYSTIDQLAPQFSSNDVMGHGDWVLESFFQQLDDPNAVEIVAIDIDFTNFQDFDRLFDGDGVFRACYVDAINRVYEPDNTYLLSVFNASFGGYSPPPNAVDNFINEQNAFVVQASANVGQSGDSWSSSIHNVINVGAWNTDLQGNSLASDINAIDFNDVYADGYVIDETWGNGFNFGTSFAAPRVSAEIINFYDTVLTPLILEDGLQSSGETLSNEEMTNITDFTVSAISTEMEIFVNELGQFVGPLNVLSDDILIGLDPVEVPIEINNFSFQVGEARNYAGDGLTILDLDDPLQLTEYSASSSDDTITGFSNAVFFGGEGNDTFKSDISAFNQIFVGGEGGDTYSINASGFMTIYDNGYSGTDVVETSGIGLLSETSYVATIEGRHLLGYDTYSQQSILVIDYQSPENRIEQIKFADGSYTYDEVINHISLSDNFLGDLSWSAASSTFTSSEINAGLQYYKDWYNQSSNNAPYITSSPTTEINEKVGYSYIIIALDDDPESSLSINVSGLPSWLNFNSTTREIYGTPEQPHVGNYTFEVEVLDDKGASVTQSITLTVNNVNDAPVFDFAPPNSTDEDVVFEYQLTATDIDMDVVDNETLNYEAVTTPDWMTVSSGGLIAGTPENEDVGEHAITVKVTDSAGATDTRTFQLTVNNVNDEPVLERVNIPDVVVENVNINYQFQATDQDIEHGDKLSFSHLNLPHWLNLTDDGLLTGVPPSNESGSHNFSIIVSDRNGGSAQQDYTIQIKPNEPPKIISAQEDLKIEEGSGFVYEILVDDPDTNPVDLVFESPNLPEWLNFDQETFKISGTTGSYDPGEYNIDFTIKDSAGGSDSQTFLIEVLNVNNEPYLPSNLNRTINEGDVFNWQPVVLDHDLPISGEDRWSQNWFLGGLEWHPDSKISDEEITFSARDLPSWLNMDAMTGKLTGTPTGNDIGFHEFAQIVTDKSGASHEKVYSIDVKNTNDAPVLEVIPDNSTDEDAAFEYQLRATDIDADVVDETLTYEAVEKPEWMSVSSGGLITGTPTNDDVGEHAITVKVTDSAGESDTKTFTLIVNNINDAPVLGHVSEDLLSVNEDDALGIQLAVSDVDAGDSHVFRIIDSTIGLDLYVSDDGFLSGLPDNENVGDNFFIIEVEDADGLADNRMFNLTVSNTNDAPYFFTDPFTSIPFLTDQDSPFSYTLAAADDDLPEYDTLTFSSLYELPDGLSLSSDGELSGIPTNNAVGVHDIYVDVTDLAGQTASQWLSLTVNNINDAPVLESISNSSTDEDAPFEYQLTATDIDMDVVDNETLSYEALEKPDWMSVSLSGLITGTPENDDVGEHAITVKVTDSAGERDNKTFTLNVNNTNDAPVIKIDDTNGTLTDALDGSSFSHQLSVTDEDVGDTHVYSIESVKFAAPNGISSGYSSSEGISNRPSLEQVGDTTGSTDLYWKDYDGSSYLVTAQNVGAYSSQALDDGNIAFVYAVHSGTEWQLNYRVFDPLKKTFKIEETVIGSNIQTDAVGGVQVYLSLDQLGLGRLGIELHHEKDYVHQGANRTLKYVELSWPEGDYLTSPGTIMVPQLTSYRPMTGPEEKLQWFDENGDYHLVAHTSREVLETSYEYLLNGNILMAWVENDGAARCRVFDPNNKVFLSEANLIASDPIFTDSYQITSSLNHEYADTATYAIQIVDPIYFYGPPEYRYYRLDNLNLPDVDVQVGWGAGLSADNDSTGSTDLLLDDNGQSYLVTEQNVGAYSSQLLNDGNMAIVYAVHHGNEWHLNYRIFDPTIKDFITDETSIASNLHAEAIGGVNVSIELTALGESGFSAELKNATQVEQTLKYTEVTQSLDVQHNELRPIDDISWLSLDNETGFFIRHTGRRRCGSL